MNPSTARHIIKFLTFFHNFSYKYIGKLSIIENGGLHPKHHILNYHQFFLDNCQPEDQVLDVGSGNGYVAFQLAQYVKSVIGIEIDHLKVDLSSRHYQLPNLTYILGDATSYKFHNKFDVIILSNVLEHIHHRVTFLKKLKRLGKKMLVRVPMIDRDWIVFYKKSLGLEYRLDSTHYTEYTLSELQAESVKSGWHIKKYSIQFGELWAVLVTV